MKTLFYQNNKAVIEELPAPKCGVKEVLVANAYSVVSAGSEVFSINESSVQSKAGKKENIDKIFDLFTGMPFQQNSSDTVGCIACRNGELAVGTSTGGSFYKLPGRVGDSPIPGAGLYASNRCAVCCSGKGETFLQLLISKTVDFWSINIDKPEILAQKAVELLTKHGSKGGVIVMTNNGKPGVSHNCNSFPVIRIDKTGISRIM